MMKIGKLIVCLCSAAALVCGCSPAEKKAADLYELAAFELQQFNRENALKLYDRILKEYPDTQAAHQAEAARQQLLAEKQ